MKKLIVTLLALSLLLSCVSALADAEPRVYKMEGISLDFDDVLESAQNYMNLVEYGIVSRDPFISCLFLEYYALDKELMKQLSDNFNSYSEELQQNIQLFSAGIRTILAYVLVTDLPEPDSMMEMLFDGTPEGAEITEFGEYESYHYFVLTLPGYEEPEDYNSFTEYEMDPEEIREAYEGLRADTQAVRTAFIERLQAAALFAPIDPQASLPGQILSFETTDIDGNPVSSADLFKDNKITMVNIWGTWCHNCVDEMTELAEIHTRLQEKGCGIVGVESEREPIEGMVDEIHAFLEEKGTNYPNVIMPQGNEIFSKISGYPTTIFVDREGRILTVPITGAMVSKYEPTVDLLLSGEKVDTFTGAGATKNESGEYRVIVYSLKGEPVEGAVIQLCDDTTCAFQATDADGIAVFSVENQKVYDVHVLMAPEGYVKDEGEYKTLETWSDVNIFLEEAT
ncbi:MAG: TlpA family protein disulfide reductase [Clostridia bacterium]|nr:TlpA family protein disulfide reductase [Clostridia bacterium]